MEWWIIGGAVAGLLYLIVVAPIEFLFIWWRTSVAAATIPEAVTTHLAMSPSPMVDVAAGRLGKAASKEIEVIDAEEVVAVLLKEIDFEELVREQLKRQMKGVTTNLGQQLKDAYAGEADEAMALFAQDEFGISVTDLSNALEADGHKGKAIALRRGPRALPYVLDALGYPDHAKRARDALQLVLKP